MKGSLVLGETRDWRSALCLLNEELLLTSDGKPGDSDGGGKTLWFEVS